MRADTIYKNGRFYTENKTAPWAEAVAIEGKNLIAVGTESDAIEPNFKKDENGEYTGWVQEPFDAIDEVIYEKLDWYPPQEITDEMVDPLLDYFKAHGITSSLSL